MSIILKINDESKLKEELEDTIYDYFSLLGLRTIMNYINELYREYEFNPCEFASNFTEYSNAIDSEFNLDDLVNDYDFMIENEDNDENVDKWEQIARAIEYDGKMAVLWIRSESVKGIVLVH